MKLAATSFSLLVIFGFCRQARSQSNADLGFSSVPAYIADTSQQPNVWYIPVLSGGTVQFNANPTAGVDPSTIQWSFTNGSPSTGTGNAVSVTYDQDAAEGSVNNVTFSCQRTANGVVCPTSNRTIANVIVITMEFATDQTNGPWSSDPTDALVRLKNQSNPQINFTLYGRMRVSVPNVLPQSLQIYLTNPDSRLQFTSNLPITLTPDGSYSYFSIIGNNQSSSIGDAVIKAFKDSTTGDLLGQDETTVYYFDPSSLQITNGSNYSISNNLYQPKESLI